MKKKTAILLSMVMLVSLLGGCGSAPETSNQGSTQTETTVESSTENQAGQNDTSVTDNSESVQEISTYINADRNSKGSSDSGYKNSGSSAAGEAGELIFDDAAYVLIYNPLRSHHTGGVSDTANNAKSGYFGGQILSGLNRAGGLDDLDGKERTEISQFEMNGFLDITRSSQTGIKAGGLEPHYKKGEKHTFGYGLPEESRSWGEFTCDYEGKYCYIWTIKGSLSKSDAEKAGTAFDEEIYEEVVSTYGSGRFTENGGKINILYYPMSNESLRGFFWNYELLAEDEVDPVIVEAYGLNTGHAIININSRVAIEETYGTLAHEFQHLIAATDWYANYEYVALMETWLDEAMAASASELLYPGTAESISARSYDFFLSDQFKYGQSLYNFDTSNDLGAYGAVHLFQEYLKELTGGKAVFGKIHKSWRYDKSKELTEEVAIVNALDSKTVDAFDGWFAYPDNISERFDNEYEEIFSKIVLDFYISAYRGSLTDWDFYKEVLAQSVNSDEVETIIKAQSIFDEIGGTDIEGGGCILVATKDGNFSIPSGADENLVYVSFDSEFNPQYLYVKD